MKWHISNKKIEKFFIGDSEAETKNKDIPKLEEKDLTKEIDNIFEKFLLKV